MDGMPSNDIPLRKGPSGPKAPPNSGSPLAFSTPALLAAFDASSISGFARVGCGAVNDEYQLITAPSPALLAAADGVNVIAAAAPAGAVWARAFCRNLPAQYQSEWFLDPAGSDQNDGLTVATPLRTLRELSNRLRGAYIGQNVVVTLAAGNYGDHPLQLDVEIAQGFTISVVGNVTSTTDTVAAILPTVAGAASTNAGAQRGTLTATTFDFQAVNDRQRLRITAGTAANIGGIAYVTRVVTPGVGGVVNTTRWGRLSNPLTSTVVTNLTIAPGDTYAVDTLNSQIGYLDVRVRGNGKIVLQDCLIRPSSSSSLTHRCVNDNGNVNGILTYGCIFESAASLLFQSSTFTMAVCSLSSDLGNIVFSSGGIVVSRMNVFTRKSAATNLNVQSGVTMQCSEGTCYDNVQLILQTGGTVSQIGQTNNDAQFVDGTAAHAIDVAAGGIYWSHSSSSLVWGLNNAYSSSAILVEQTGTFSYNPRPSIPGGTVDFSVGGTTGAWAALPIIITTAAAGTAASGGAGCMMVS